LQRISNIQIPNVVNNFGMKLVKVKK